MTEWRLSFATLVRALLHRSLCSIEHRCRSTSRLGTTTKLPHIIHHHQQYQQHHNHHILVWHPIPTHPIITHTVSFFFAFSFHLFVWSSMDAWVPLASKQQHNSLIIHNHHNYNHRMTLHHITHTLSRLYLLSKTTLYSITTYTSWHKRTQTDTLSLLANVPTLATGRSKNALQPIIKTSHSLFLFILWHHIVDYHSTDTVTLQKADTPCYSDI